MSIMVSLFYSQFAVNFAKNGWAKRGYKREAKGLMTHLRVKFCV